MFKNTTAQKNTKQDRPESSRLNRPYFPERIKYSTTDNA